MIIDVIIPAYNAEDTIEKCIDSILKQTYTNFHIYIINDGSTDKTLNKLEKYKIYNNITIINQENMGAFEARNVGIKNIKNSFFTFVDADDYITENYLLDLVNKQKEKDYDMVISSYKTYKNNVFDISSDISDRDFLLENKKQEKDIYDLITFYNADGICSKLYKASIAKGIVMRELQIGEDLLFNIQYLFNCKNVAYINKHNYIYVIQQDSLMRKPCCDLLKQLEKVVEQLKNNTIKKIFTYRIFLEFVRNLYFNNITYHHGMIPQKIKEIITDNIEDLKPILTKNKYYYYCIISILVKNNNSFIFNMINNIKYKVR